MPIMLEEYENNIDLEKKVEKEIYKQTGNVKE